MNSVGIDVSKGKCMVAVMRPFGEIVLQPFEISHSPGELNALAQQLNTFWLAAVSKFNAQRLLLLYAFFRRNLFIFLLDFS